MANLLERIRVWIDGEEKQHEANHAVKKILQAEKSESEKFLLEILQKIDEVLMVEIVRLPSGIAYVPSGFIVFLSDEEEKKLPKDKREFFEQGLSEVTLGRAKELAGKSKLTVTSFKINIRNDGTLASGEIEVKAIFDKSLKDTLLVTPTPQATERQVADEDKETIKDFGTIKDSDFKLKALYRLEIWQDGKRINESPIAKHEITVGRDTVSGKADVRLNSDNQKISRLHASIRLEESDEVWVTSLGQNPTIVSGHTLMKDEQGRLEKDGEIQIYEFTLRLKFAQ